MPDEEKVATNVQIEEIWVGLKDWPNYEVSNYGRIVNVKTAFELQPYIDGKGYQRVQLYNRGVRKDLYVHRLVAQCFFLNYAEGIEVRHVDDTHREDNGVYNLTLGQACRKGETDG